MENGMQLFLKYISFSQRNQPISVKETRLMAISLFFYKKLDIAIEFTEFSRGSREMFRRLFFKVVPSLIERYRVFCSFMMCQSNSFGSLKVNDTAEDKAKENSVC